MSTHTVHLGKTVYGTGDLEEPTLVDGRAGDRKETKFDG
jgi:hypothetical protein